MRGSSALVLDHPRGHALLNDKGTVGSLRPHLWSQTQPDKSCDKTGVPGASRTPWAMSRSPGGCPCLDHQGYERVLGQGGGGSLSSYRAWGALGLGCWEVRGQRRGKRDPKVLLGGGSGVGKKRPGPAPVSPSPLQSLLLL